MRSNRLEVELENRLADAEARHRTGQITAIVGSRLTVVTTAGATLIVPRLSTWTPAVGDVVLLAITPGGWIALGKILP